LSAIARAGLSPTAMVLAAGLGQRMRPITDRLPKPLVAVNGRTMLDQVLDRLVEAGVERAVVNVHHLADQMERHLAARRGGPAVAISDERGALLDSGGGVLKALPLLGPRPFMLANADTLWIDGARSNATRLAEHWREDMDVLLLVAATSTATGYDGRGDFAFATDGRLRRRAEREVTPFAYAGFAVIRPELFDGMPAGPFSLNRVFDRAAERERLFGMRLDGVWMHVGTPAAIEEAEACLAKSAA
jgi:MurNAc alpha-1-phosphate uridylyltransferase